MGHRPWAMGHGPWAMPETRPHAMDHRSAVEHCITERYCSIERAPALCRSIARQHRTAVLYHSVVPHCNQALVLAHCSLSSTALHYCSEALYSSSTVPLSRQFFFRVGAEHCIVDFESGILISGDLSFSKHSGSVDKALEIRGQACSAASWLRDRCMDRQPQQPDR